MPTVNKIATYKKLNKNLKNTFQLKISSNSRPLESFQFKLCNLHKPKNLHFFREINILKNNKNRPIIHNNGLSKTKMQTLTSL